MGTNSQLINRALFGGGQLSAMRMYSYASASSGQNFACPVSEMVEFRSAYRAAPIIGRSRLDSAAHTWTCPLLFQQTWQLRRSRAVFAQRVSRSTLGLYRLEMTKTLPVPPVSAP